MKSVTKGERKKMAMGRGWVASERGITVAQRRSINCPRVLFARSRYFIYRQSVFVHPVVPVGNRKRGKNAAKARSPAVRDF